MLKKSLTIVLVAGLGLGVMNCKSMQEYKARVAAIEIDDIDLQEVADGEYRGSYDAVLVKATVKVVVKDHRIESIELVEHENGRGKDAEVIPGQVVTAQSLQVDTISGASSSSKVILEAIEQALKQGIE